MGSKPKDITGKRVGHLVAVRNTGEKKNGSYIWELKCDCGKTHYLPLGAFNYRRNISCGCCKNIRNPGKVVYKGERYTVSELSKMFGVRTRTIYDKLCKGFSVEEIVNHPNMHFKDYGLDKPTTITSLAIRAGVSRMTIYERIKNGWWGADLLRPRLDCSETLEGVKKREREQM